jgi:hypothetical protein
LAIDQSTILAAVAEHELSVISRNSPVGDGAREIGIKASEFLNWARTRNIEFALTAVGRALVNPSPAEFVRSQIYSLGSAVDELGIDSGTLKAALLAGELRQISDPRVSANESRIESGSLLNWIEAKAITLRPAIWLASTVVRGRALSTPTSAATVPPKSIVADALRLLSEETTNEAEIKAANERAMMARYAAVLRRRLQPNQNDAADLAEICRQLGFGATELERDAAVLDKADQLEAQTLKIADAVKELETAGADFKATTKRHEAEETAARIRLQEAFRLHGLAVRAPSELQELRERRPDLFV